MWTGQSHSNRRRCLRGLWEGGGGELSLCKVLERYFIRMEIFFTGLSRVKKCLRQHNYDFFFFKGVHDRQCWDGVQNLPCSSGNIFFSSFPGPLLCTWIIVSTPHPQCDCLRCLLPSCTASSLRKQLHWTCPSGKPIASHRSWYTQCSQAFAKWRGKAMIPNLGIQ